MKKSHVIAFFFVLFFIPITQVVAQSLSAGTQDKTEILSDKAVWSYVFTKPTVKNWAMQYPLPKGGYNVGEMHTDKNWQKDKLNMWMTTKFTLPANYKPGNLFLEYQYDDNIAIYINGKLIFQGVSDYTRLMLRMIPNCLKAGDNVVAVFCNNNDSKDRGCAFVALWTDENPPLDIEAVLPVGGKWSYTFDDPGQQWTTQFPLPKSKLGCGIFYTDNLWNRSKYVIWMTQVVTLPQNYVPEEMLVQYVIDDEIWVNVNGVEVFHGNFQRTWRTLRDVKNPLKPGKNIIAVKGYNHKVHGRYEHGCVGIDIFTRKYTAEDKKNPLEHLQREPPADSSFEAMVESENARELTESEKKIQLAMNCFKLGQDQLAVAELKRVAESDEKDVQANCILGMYSLTKRGNPAEGFAYFQKCVKVNSKDPAILNNYAVAAMESKKYNSALQAWERLAKIDATFPALGQNVGCMMDLMNRKRIVLKEAEQLRLVELYITACSNQNRDRDPATAFLLTPPEDGICNRTDCDSAFTQEFKRGRETVKCQPYEVRKTHYMK